MEIDTLQSVKNEKVIDSRLFNATDAKWQAVPFITL